MTTLLELFLGVSVAGLGSPDYPAREAAQARLAAAGWKAWPAVLDHEDDPDPEVAERCRRLDARLKGRFCAAAERWFGWPRALGAASRFASEPRWCEDWEAAAWNTPVGLSILNSWAGGDTHPGGKFTVPYLRLPGQRDGMLEGIKVWANYYRSQWLLQPLPRYEPWDSPVYRPAYPFPRNP